MADVKWIKITTDIFDDEKILLIESLPDSYAIITVWFKLLCLAGKTNNSGVFMMNNRVAYTDKMLATIFRMKDTTVQLALQTFVNFGMVEIIDGVITIPNWNKHQSLDAYEKKKERDRLYQAERRANQRALVAKSSDSQTTGSSDVAVSDKEIDKEKEKDKDTLSKDKVKRKKAKAFSDDEGLNKAIMEFIAFRKNIKKPMTDYAVERLMRRLNDMSSSIPEQIDILNQSIDKGWQDIYPLKNNSKPQRTTGGRSAPTAADDEYIAKQASMLRELLGQDEL